MKRKVLSIALLMIAVLCPAREIKDYAERTVTLNKPAERVVVMADNSFVIIKQLKATDKIVALDSKTKGNWDLYLVSKTNPELAVLPDVGKTKNPNYELIISLEPDLILFKGNKAAADTLQNKTGIPVAAIISKNGFDFEIYNLVGSLLGKEKEAAAVINELTSKKASLENKLSKLSMAEKKRAYIVVQNSKNNLFKTQKNSMSLELASVENVAADASKVDEWGFAEISQEEFINWDPDIIFLDYPMYDSAIRKQTIIRDPSYKFSNAVKKNAIYNTHSFSAPKDYAFVIAEAYYYARIAYPDLISEKEYKAAINSIFDKTYGIKNYYEEWKRSLN